MGVQILRVMVVMIAWMAGILNPCCKIFW